MRGSLGYGSNIKELIPLVIMNMDDVVEVGVGLLMHRGGRAKGWRLELELKVLAR